MNTLDELMHMYDEEYPAFVKRVSYRVGGMTNAEDVVQEAFTRALTYIEAAREINSVRAWFTTILNNATRDFKQEERMDGMVRDEPVTEPLDELCFKHELIETVLAEADKYSMPENEVLMLAIRHEWKPREISKISPLNPNNIRVIIHRFKHKMRHKYGDEVYSRPGS